MTRLLEFDHKKATQAINYLTRKEGGQIDKLKLIKLIYLADRYHIRRYGRPLVNDAYFAMPLGPVGSSVKDIAELSGFLSTAELSYAKEFIQPGKTTHSIVSKADVDTDVFSKSELEALDFVFSEFGDKTGSALVNITHRYPEWLKFKSALDTEETTREPMQYQDFFGDPENAREDRFSLDKDTLAASMELFEEDYKVAEYWK